ncbi:hypothetical protein BG000_001695 [Podila horticola]|nr:hypothetical protein BG000_001695 [Podila horticola]
MGGSRYVSFNPVRNQQTWTCSDYTLTSDGRLALRKHAHRILAPTCQGTESLRVLRNSNCVNLTEMNFIVENNASVENEPWVEALFDLLTVNPHLTAISLENLRLHDASTEEQMSKLLGLLDQNPVITSVYIGTDSHIRDESGVEKMTAIQIRLLARVPTDSVRTLYVRTAIPRSGRGRPTSSGRPWPARESPAYAKMKGSELHREVKRISGHDLTVEFLIVNGSEPEVSPTWNCRQLQLLDIQLMYSKYADYDNIDVYLSLDEFPELVQGTEMWASSFMQQMGSLSQLHDLRLTLYPVFEPDHSKFLALSLDPVGGLPRLQGLRQLRTVAFSGLLHSIGEDEVRWMRQYWPRLISLEVPILRETEEGKTGIQWVANFSGQAPKFDQWYPGFKI